MGRAMVAQAFLLYAQPLASKPRALLVLVYMASIPNDRDAEPKFWMGSKAIAEMALGRPKGNDADLLAVKRCIGELRTVGAITTVVRAAPGRRHATYRLHLDAPAAVAWGSNNDHQQGSNNDHPMGVVRRPPNEEKELDIGRGKTQGLTVANGPPANPKNALRAIDGGRSDDDVGRPVQLSMMFAVPDVTDAEPVAEGHLWDGMNEEAQ